MFRPSAQEQASSSAPNLNGPHSEQRTVTFDRQDLRARRIDELLESCRTQALTQIIGPFGLTPAMFEDKDGGSVTTQHNAAKGIFAKESEEYKRKDYAYSQAKTDKKREAGIPLGKGADISSGTFLNAYTGIEEPLQRHDSAGNPMFDKNGNPLKNYSLDHAIPLHELHKTGGWMKDKAARGRISSVKENLYYTTSQANSAKSDNDPDDALSREKGYDQRRINPRLKKAREATEELLPDNWERLRYHGSELAVEGARSAGKTAVRQAVGILLHEFANSIYVEVRGIVLAPAPAENLLDRIVEALERTMQRVVAKLGDALDALASGGVQGAVSTLLTFLVNNLVTTSAKIVTIIREGMASLWHAMKLLWAPPANMSGADVAREVTKLIAGVVTTGLGLVLDEAVKALVLAVPLFAPVASLVAPAVTGLLTGIMAAFVIYAIDRLFDWLSDPGTEMLNALVDNLDAEAEIGRRLGDFMQQQYANSRGYQAIVVRHQAMMRDLAIAEERLAGAVTSGSAAIDFRSGTLSVLRIGFDDWQQAGDELSRLISDYKLEE